MRKLTLLIERNVLMTLIILLWLKSVIISFTTFQLPLYSWFDIMVVFINPIGIIMIMFGISFLWRKRLSPLMLFIIYLLLLGLLYANVLYYRFYIDFVTVSVLLQLNNVGGLGPSTVELFSPLDTLLFVDVAVIGYVIFKMNRKKNHPVVPNKKRYAFTGVGLLVFTLAIALIQNPFLLQTDYDREELVKSLGLYNYQLINIANGVKSPVMKAFADEADVKEVQSYIQGKEEKDSFQEFGIAKGKNVVFISLESTQNFVVNQKVNGKEITPFLNELIQDSFYFNNIYDQAAQGKTSDAEFMINTGLYPLPSGSVFVRRPNNEFQSLPHILREANGYTAAAFHGNDASFWNRDDMYQSLGFDRFFSKKDYHVTEENSVNYGLKDIPFFEQSMEKLLHLSEPYMASFLTLTNHFPFLLEEEDQSISPANTSVGVVNRYVTTVRYEDEALKRFFELVKEKDMYEDTVFVIYGDHYGISQKYEAGVYELLGQEDTEMSHLELQKVPVIIHVPGQEGKKIETVGGTIDIHATVSELMGVRDKEQINFSRNLFTRGNEAPVVFRDGSIVTGKYAYVNGRCYDKHKQQVVKSNTCTDYLETARNELYASDQIILGDLFRFIGK
ncbi:LTA synthase family protein [Virgibacillus dokdonensis]|uniref:LTA synthase family protein n=1 Tax=Virgibacillus dokdonensis TaxID=302167 RepID=UPI00098B0B34|nr:LTA synthase family protein [Virgibacillus dokdonensis]